MNTTKKKSEWVFEEMQGTKEINGLIADLKRKGEWDKLSLADKNLIENSSRSYIFDNGINMIICFPCIYLDKAEYKSRVFVYVSEDHKPNEMPKQSEIPNSKDLEELNDFIWNIQKEQISQPPFYEDETIGDQVEYFRFNKVP